MTVAELIEKLKTLPQDALVLHRGYEDGYDPADDEGPVAEQVVKRLDAAWYNGQYELLDYLTTIDEEPSEYYKDRYDFANPITAVII